MLKGSWFRNYFGKASKKLAMGTSVGGPGCEEARSKTHHELVLLALADARFQFRTAPSIAAETGMTEMLVRCILESNENVRKAPLCDENGNFLYTLRSRPRTAREILAETRASLAGSSK
jgi:hypothetical protein